MHEMAFTGPNSCCPPPPIPCYINSITMPLDVQVRTFDVKSTHNPLLLFCMQNSLLLSASDYNTPLSQDEELTAQDAGATAGNAGASGDTSVGGGSQI